MLHRTWEELSEVERLQCLYSDRYKEVNGFRPRFMERGQWTSAEWLKAQLDALTTQQDRYIAELSRTFAGREQLREEGYCVEAESDPKLAQYAEWLRQEREREYGSLYL